MWQVSTRAGHDSTPSIPLAAPRPLLRATRGGGSLGHVPEDDFDVAAMIARFRERAAAVRRRGLPPVEGPERRRLLEQLQLDYQDFAMIGDATGELVDGVLTLRVDLRPRPQGAESAR